MTHAHPYVSSIASSNQVVVGNGASLPITQSGNISFSSGNFVFHLSDVLHVSSLCKNIFSVAQLTRDLLVRITFYPWGYNIYDLHSSAILFQGQ